MSKARIPQGGSLCQTLISKYRKTKISGLPIHHAKAALQTISCCLIISEEIKTISSDRQATYPPKYMPSANLHTDIQRWISSNEKQNLGPRVIKSNVVITSTLKF